MDFVADRLGRLRLSKENVAPLHISTRNHGPARASPTIINSDAQACRIGAYLGTNPEPELSQRIFYVLLNTFT